MKYADIIIIGGGASGFFAAINAKMNNPALTVKIIEQAKDVLSKVRVSGGGRCNVTHACFDPKELCTFYPRGSRELLGSFYSHGPKQTIEWFKNQGVTLKIEADGRMFPVSDSSETIIQCFLSLTKNYGIEVINNVKVKNYLYKNEVNDTIQILTESETYSCQNLIIATGSSPFIWNILKEKGYEIIDPVPSLFTFNLPKHPICKLMGLTVQHTGVKIKDSKIQTEGPLLITHWGLSGPAILKASAWGANILSERNYKFEVLVDWIPEVSIDSILSCREEMARKKVLANSLFNIPSRLWHFLMDNVSEDKEKNWASLSKLEMNILIKNLKEYQFEVAGKTTFKEEFVTAGGVALHQINFKTFESKLHPGLFMTGEVLNIDAVTGGFNFQAAWTGGYLAGLELSKRHPSSR